MSFVGGVGYLNIDLLYWGLSHMPGLGEEVYSKGFDVQLGGGIPATMVNLSRLGVASKIVTFMGDDFFSEIARNALKEYDVDIENLYRGENMPVAVSSAMVQGQDRSFVSYIDQVEITPDILDRAYTSLKGAKVVDMQDGFLEVYQRLQKESTLLVFDTGWSDDLSLAKYGKYLDIADYYVPNQKEALKITGANTIEKAAECLSEFFENVIIKLDRHGCLLKNRCGIAVIPSMDDVKAVDATGAGDAFLSGFMYGLFHDYPVEQCIRFGNITGGTCVQGVGCLAKYVTEQELLKLAR